MQHGYIDITQYDTGRNATVPSTLGTRARRLATRSGRDADHKKAGPSSQLRVCRSAPSKQSKRALAPVPPSPSFEFCSLLKIIRNI